MTKDQCKINPKLEGCRKHNYKYGNKIFNGETNKCLEAKESLDGEMILCYDCNKDYYLKDYKCVKNP